MKNQNKLNDKFKSNGIQIQIGSTQTSSTRTKKTENDAANRDLTSTYTIIAQAVTSPQNPPLKTNACYKTCGAAAGIVSAIYPFERIRKDAFISRRLELMVPSSRSTADMRGSSLSCLEDFSQRPFSSCMISPKALS